MRRLLGGRSSAGPASTAQAARSPAVAGAAHPAAVEASVLRLAGRLGAALAELEAALQESPAHPALVCERARTLLAAGRLREALEQCLQLEALGCVEPDFLALLGHVQARCGWHERAEASLRKALAHDDARVEAVKGLALVLTRLGRFDEASAMCERALAIDRQAAETWMILGECRTACGDGVGALEAYREVAALPGWESCGHHAIGVALRGLGRRDEAVHAFTASEGLRTDASVQVDGFVDLALEYEMRGDPARGIEILERELPSRPSLEGHRLYAQLLLETGRLAEAWDHYEFRWMLDPLVTARAGPHRPPWIGQPLHGKTVLLRLEQGYGDVIQFVRYARHLRALGATVMMQDFAGLATAVDGIAGILSGNDTSTPFDYYADLLSLPRVFGTDLDSIPGRVPYVSVDRDRAVRMQAALQGEGRLKVGLVWGGNAAYSADGSRSISLAALTPLLAMPGVRMFSLQKGPRAAEAQQVGADLVDLGSAFADFADTAAAIAGLDLVIAVDTAVAHLAGALGKPVWVMLPSVADWRWMQHRDASPWYPTMRLFRRDRNEGWEAVTQRIVRALKDHLERGEPLVPADSSRDDPAGRLAPLPIGAVRQRFSAIAKTPVGIVQYPVDGSAMATSLLHYGDWLAGLVRLLAQLVEPGSAVLECSAAVGVHALAAAALAGDGGHVLIEERDRRCRRMIRHNLGANRVGNVTVLEHSFHQATVARDTSQAVADGDRDPAGESIDDLHLSRLHWIKLNDPARAERLLHGAEATIWMQRPGLLINASDGPALSRLHQSVQAFGYRVWRIEMPLFDPANFHGNPDNVLGGAATTWLIGLPEEAEVRPALLAFHELL